MVDKNSPVSEAEPVVEEAEVAEHVLESETEATDEVAGEVGPVDDDLGEDPARILGIAGLILSIVLATVGLVVSIIAVQKSKQAGFKNLPARAGVVVGILTTGLVVIGIILGATGFNLAGACAGLPPGIHDTADGKTVSC
jgi:hypothetical protein